MIPRKLKNLAEEYRRGMAKAMGIPPEEISQERVEKWVKDWARAFLTPEAFRQLFGHSSPTYIEQSTYELHSSIRGLRSSRRGGKGL